MFGIFLVLVQFMQAVLGYSALRAPPPRLLPMMVVMMPLSAVAPTIAQRVGTRNVLLTGVGLFGVGLALLAMMVSADGGYWSVLPGLLVLAIGHRPVHEPVDDGDHRVAAAGQAGRGVGAQRHGP